jgi:hypothetical protein
MKRRCDDDGDGKHIRSQTHIGFPMLQVTNESATCPQTSALLPAKFSSPSDVEPLLLSTIGTAFAVGLPIFD